MDSFNKRGRSAGRSGDRKGGFSARPSNDRGGRPSFGGDRERGGDKSFGGRPSFGDRKSSGGRPSFGGDRGPAKRFEMHAAVCAKCGSSCEVPFRPFAGQEVFCNNCFSKDGVSAPGKSFSRNNAPRPTTATVAEVPQVLKLELNQIHSKIDKILSIVQKLIASELPVPAEVSEEIEEIIEEVKVKKAVKKAEKPAPKKVVKKKTK